MFLLVTGLMVSNATTALTADDPTPTGEEHTVLPVACSPETPTVAAGETTTLRAFVFRPGAILSTPQYAWSATGGRIEGNGATANWSFSGAVPASYTATVRVEGLRHNSMDCSVQVIVKEPRRDPARESGRSLLHSTQKEDEGYGLYSYLLFGSGPDDETQDRYAQAMNAYWRLMPEINELQRFVPRQELNVTYVLVDMAPGSAVSAQWALQHYDYARARAVLRTLPGDHRTGPYIVSAFKPLATSAALVQPYLYQDMSSVPPQLVASWMKEFLNQAAQERPWEERTGRRLALRLRTTLGVAAMGLEPVQKALDSLIAWIPKVQ